MNIEVESDTTRVLQRVDLRNKTADLRSVAGGQALVRLGAWVRGCAAGDFPLVGPVSVGVTAHARVSAYCLSVFAPETVGGLGVDETVWVDNWHDWKQVSDFSIFIRVVAYSL